ncbi:MAG: tetratricopeptide repeat protein [Alphaproteobacteria bacterium]|nr:tetratricopeptide repeat protein [Alphaproteobacteria bacterium]
MQSTLLGGALNTVFPNAAARARWVVVLLLAIYPLSAAAQVPDVGPGRCYGGCGAPAPSGGGGGGYGGGDAAAMAGAQMMMGVFSSFVNGMNQARQAQQQARINQALTLNNQGITFYNAGRYQDAVSAFQQAVALKPNDRNMQNNLLLAQQQFAAQGAAAMAASHQQMTEAKQRVDAMLGNLDQQVSRQDAASTAGLDFAGGPAPAGTRFFGTGGGPGSPRGGGGPAAAPSQAGGLDFATDNESLFSKGYHGSAPPDLRSGSYSATPAGAAVVKNQGLDFAVSNRPPPAKLVAAAPPPEVTVPDVAGHSARERDIVVDAIQVNLHNAYAADLHLRDLLAKSPRDQDLRDAESYLNGWNFAAQVSGGRPQKVSEEQKASDLASPKPGLKSLTGASVAPTKERAEEDLEMRELLHQNYGDAVPANSGDKADLEKWHEERDRIFVTSWSTHGDNFSAVRLELEKMAKADPDNTALRDALRIAQGAEAQQVVENGAPVPAK